ncbi:MAG: DUF4126 family protein [Polyangiaceae bacterium]
MTIYLLAVAIGIIAGLRSMTAPAAVSWAANFGWLKVHGTPVAFLGNNITAYILSLLAIGELVADKLPRTPSRKTPGPFIGRIFAGALSGAAIGATGDSWIVGAALGAVGAVIGTLGGAAGRARLTVAFGRDLPAAIVEDVIAVGGAFAIVHFLA